MTEGRVVDEDVLRRDPLDRQVRLEDLVRCAGIDVVRARKHPAFNPLALHQVVNGWNRLLIRRRPGVENVSLTLLALVLHRVEEQAVQLGEHRQHGLPRHRSPASEDRRDAADFDQFSCLLREQRPVRSGIDNHRFQRPTQHTALRVLLVNEHEHRIFQGCL